MELGSCPIGRTIDDRSRRRGRDDREARPGPVGPTAGVSGLLTVAWTLFASPSPRAWAWANDPLATDLQPAGRSGGPFRFAAAALALALALALAWGWRTGGDVVLPAPPRFDWPIGPGISKPEPDDAGRRGATLDLTSRSPSKAFARTLDWSERLILLGLYGGLAVRLGGDGRPGDLLLLVSEGLVVAVVLPPRPALTVSVKAIDWLVAGLAISLPMLAVPSGDPAALSPLAAWVGFGLLASGLLVQIFAKLSLGRSFGCIAATIEDWSSTGPHRDGQASDLRRPSPRARRVPRDPPDRLESCRLCRLQRLPAPPTSIGRTIARVIPATLPIKAKSPVD